MSDSSSTSGLAGGGTPAIVSFCFGKIEYFMKAGIQKRKAACKLCKREIKESGTTTSNFVRHVRNVHPDTYTHINVNWFKSYEQRLRAPVSGLKQKSMDNYVHSKKFPPTHPTQRHINTAIVENLVIDCSFPLSVVENSAFNKFMSIVEPRYVPISRTKVVSLLEATTHTMRADLLTALKEVEHLGITLDIWSDRTMRGYLAITAHYIKEFTLQSSVLICQRMNGRHTGENIHDTVERCMDDFSIASKIRYIVTDNAANMKRAFSVQLMGEGEGEEETEEQGCLDDETLWEDVDEIGYEISAVTRGKVRLSCFAHTLQLAIGDGLKVNKGIYGATGKASKMTSLLHTSTTFKDIFEKRLPNRSLKKMNSTRWNSTLEHLKSVISCGQDVLALILTEAGQDALILTNTQWAQLQETINLLDPFLEATVMCQSDKLPTVGGVIPSVLALVNHLSELETVYLTSVKDELTKSMKRRFSGILALTSGVIPLGSDDFAHKVYRVAAYLDPVYHGWLDADFLHLEAAALAELKAHIIAEVKEYTSAVVPPAVPVAAEGESLDPPPPMKKGLFSMLKKPNSTPTANTSWLDEVAKYETAAASYNGACLQFWHDNSQLVRMRTAVPQTFCAPASSAAVERVFSHGGIFMRPHRSRLAPKTLSNLVFAKCNRL